MNIKPLDLTIRDLVKGYHDDSQGEHGIRSYNGLLDIRPPYQREYVYEGKQRDAVIKSIINHFPLNTMYWGERDDGTYEIIDGQQRTISICQYEQGEFSLDRRYFHSLQSDEKDRILNYKLMIFLCSGTPSEKLKWYEVINIAGKVLYPQELRNATYAGPWLADARRHFSRPGGPAYGLGGDYLNGDPLRQAYLETAIKWISAGRIENYMSANQHKSDANELWEYFQNVIEWVQNTFPTKHKFMKGVQWGELYNDHKDRRNLNPAKLDKEVERLILDDDVTSNAGIYSYLLTGDERHLNIRTFTKSMKQKVFTKQKGKCKICKKQFDIAEMEADHITPWSEGGKTDEDNCQTLCKPCNRKKSSN